MPCEDTGRVGVKCLQGTEVQALRATTRTYQRGLELTLPRCHQRESAQPTSHSQRPPGLLKHERINFSFLKISPLWYFRMEALGNSYNYQQSSDIIWLIFWLVKSGFILFFLFFMLIDIDFKRERLAYWKVTKFSSEYLIFLSFQLLHVELWAFECNLCEGWKLSTKGNGGLFFPIWIFHNHLVNKRLSSLHWII